MSNALFNLFLKEGKEVWKEGVFHWYNDSQHNDIQHNDT